MVPVNKISLKVCGMRHHGNITEVAAHAPDYMGFIFYAESSRFVGPEFQVPAGLPSSIKKVGVFVNELPDTVMATVHRCGLDLVQLHGNETPEECLLLKSHNIKVIKVFSVDDQTDFKVTNKFSEAADYFLFDTKGKYYGGNAKTFNWSVLEKYDQQKPFFLSGGLTPFNVRDVEALLQMNLHALDVNSGVEISPGIKDPEMVGRVQDELSVLNQLRSKLKKGNEVKS